MDHAICYDDSLQDLKDMCLAAKTPTKNMTEHSYRRGGAMKACESGMLPEEVQRHLGWKSTNLVHKYTDLCPHLNHATSCRIMNGNTNYSRCKTL